MKKYFCGIVISASMFLAAGEQPNVSWDFNGLENGVAVPSDGKYQATVVRSEHVAAIPGKTGKAVSIRGEYKGSRAGALIVKKFDFDFSKPFTAEVLVRFSGKIDRKMRREIFSMADTEHGPGVRFSFYYDALDFATGDGKKKEVIRTASSALTVTPEQWHLLTVTYDGKKVTLYCDGVAAAEKGMTVRPAEKTKTLSIGSYKNGLAYPLLGAVNSLKFYDFCKTAGQVAERYASIFGE